MHAFDLHCDTLFKANEENGSVINNNYHFSFEKAMKYDKYIQVMAVWIPDEYRGNKAFELASKCSFLLENELKKSEKFRKIDDFSKLSAGDYNVVLAVEGGAALCGKLENIAKLRNMGVRFMTLTWNGSNEIGDGILCENPKGLTAFGKQAISVLEDNGIIIDVSHASEPLFWDVAKLAKRPFVATHSNARSVCGNMRNLTDEQFKYICEIGGLVGLNFHRYFVSDNGEVDFDDLQKHLEHFLELGGEDVMALGSDFDGADMPDCIKGAENMQNFYNFLLSRNYSENLLNKVFFKNAYDFCRNYDLNYK